MLLLPLLILLEITFERWINFDMWLAMMQFKWTNKYVPGIVFAVTSHFVSICQSMTSKIMNNHRLYTVVALRCNWDANCHKIHRMDCKIFGFCPQTVQSTQFYQRNFTSPQGRSLCVCVCIRALNASHMLSGTMWRDAEFVQSLLRFPVEF